VLGSGVLVLHWLLPFLMSPRWMTVSGAAAFSSAMSFGKLITWAFPYGVSPITA
jgi:hypothetical protein